MGENAKTVEIGGIVGITDAASKLVGWQEPRSSVRINCDQCGQSMWIEAKQWALKGLKPDLPAICCECVKKFIDEKGIHYKEFLENCTITLPGHGPLRLRRVAGDPNGKHRTNPDR